MKKELRIASILDNMYRVERFVEEVSDEFHLNDDYFANIMLALTEAARNAIIHGNQEDPSRTVHVLMETKSQGLLFTVIDQGEGFDHKKYSEYPEIIFDNSLKGRGLIMIFSVADDVKISNKGRVIQMLFSITGVDNEIMERRYDLVREFFKEKKKTVGGTR